jgi:cytochrome c5
MNQPTGIKTPRFLSVKLMAVSIMILSVIMGMASINKEYIPKNEPVPEMIKRDSVGSVKAFMQVYTVLMSPRCMNCHPSGDVPLQGDDSHLHTMLPHRGKDGKGVFAMKCGNCHQATNTPGLHTPPGNPNWHLPPADMKMVFQGKTAHQLAKQLVDPAQNGHKNMEQLLAHASDDLVLAAWNPGEGRTLPPMSHKEFAKAWTTWLNKGAFAPPAK